MKLHMRDCSSDSHSTFYATTKVINVLNFGTYNGGLNIKALLRLGTIKDLFFAKLQEALLLLFNSKILTISCRPK